MYQPDKYQQLAMETWRGGDDQMRHALVGLAEEAGEMLGLYKKHLYKPGHNWLNCKPGTETPLVLDELGDWWYYARIATALKGVSVAEWLLPAAPIREDLILVTLAEINLKCAWMLVEFEDNIKVLDDIPAVPRLKPLMLAVNWMYMLLLHLGSTVDQLTELNYVKLNGPDAHGWKKGEK